MDLASRNGSPTKDSCNDCEGAYSSIVLPQFNRTINGVSENLIHHLESKFSPDFSIDAYNNAPKKNKPGHPYNADASYIGSPYIDEFERLEDIPHEDIYKYFEWAIIGTKTNRGMIKNDLYENPVEKTFISGDDEEMLTASQLQEHVIDVNIFREEQARERIPYLLKHLHEYSKALGYSLISFTIAYAKIRKRYINAKESPKPAAILGTQCCYEMKPNGMLGRLFTENKHGAAEGIAWIRGTSQDIYYSFAIELIELCEEVKQPLEKEDPLDYQEDFINSLVVQYIEENSTYLKTILGNRPVNNRVLKSIGTIDIDTFEEKFTKDFTKVTANNDITGGLSASELIMVTLQSHMLSTFNFLKVSVEETTDEFRTLQRALSKYYGMLSSRVYDSAGNPLNPRLKERYKELALSHFRQINSLDRLILSHGFFAMGNTALWTTTLPSITTNNNPIILHSDGYFIQTSPGKELYYLYTKEAINYVNQDIHALEEGVPVKDLYPNHGKWEVTYI